MLQMCAYVFANVYILNMRFAVCCLIMLFCFQCVLMSHPAPSFVSRVMAYQYGDVHAEMSIGCYYMRCVLFGLGVIAKHP